MKRNSCRLTYSITLTVAAAFFGLAMVLGSPLTLKAQSGAEGPQPKVSGESRVEKRINDLHARLKITQAQEEQWNKVAQVMRENAAEMAPLVKDRQEKGSALNAVENLKSYTKITEAHAAGLNRFMPVFEVLYAGMSDDQKKIADKVFTKHDHKRPKKK